MAAQSLPMGGRADNLSDFLSRAPPNSSTGFARNRGKDGAKSVVEAAILAASGQAFEVDYYPRASTMEFCVRAQLVTAAMRIISSYTSGDEEEDEGDDKLPPHEYLAREQACSQMNSTSVFHGVRRTLKGRDMSRV